MQWLLVAVHFVEGRYVGALFYQGFVACGVLQTQLPDFSGQPISLFPAFAEMFQANAWHTEAWRSLLLQRRAPGRSSDRMKDAMGQR